MSLFRRRADSSTRSSSHSLTLTLTLTMTASASQLRALVRCKCFSRAAFGRPATTLPSRDTSRRESMVCRRRRQDCISFTKPHLYRSLPQHARSPAFRPVGPGLDCRPRHTVRLGHHKVLAPQPIRKRARPPPPSPSPLVHTARILAGLGQPGDRG